MTTESLIYDWVLDEEATKGLIEALEKSERAGGIKPLVKTRNATLEETKAIFDKIFGKESRSEHSRFEF